MICCVLYAEGSVSARYRSTPPQLSQPKMSLDIAECSWGTKFTRLKTIHLKCRIWQETDGSFISVQSLSCVRLCDPWTAARQASLSITNSWSLLKLIFIESVMSSNHLVLCHPLLFLPSMFPRIRVFSGESALRIRWPKYWSFSFSISPSSEYSGLISFRKDWLDLLAVQGTQEPPPTPQFKSINSSAFSLSLEPCLLKKQGMEVEMSTQGVL